MQKRYITFDVETPNSANDRMSAIGVTVVEDGCVVKEFATLVNPEVHFNSFNIQLTGITPAMAAEGPTFGELWPSLEPVFSSGLLVAHNAQFDMSVLAKCLRDYGIHWRHQTDYACTCQMGKRCYPNLPNHRLNTLCDYLGIRLDHHQAASDSRACAHILLSCMEEGLDLTPFRRTYDLIHARTVPMKR